MFSLLPSLQTFLAHSLFIEKSGSASKSEARTLHGACPVFFRENSRHLSTLSCTPLPLLPPFSLLPLLPTPKATLASWLLLQLAEQSPFSGALHSLSPLHGRLFPTICAVPPCFIQVPDRPLLNRTPALLLSPFSLIYFPPRYLPTRVSSFICLLPAYPLEGKTHEIRDLALYLALSPVPRVESRVYLVLYLFIYLFTNLHGSPESQKGYNEFPKK